MSAASPLGNIVPFSGSTNLSNDVLEALSRRASLGKKAWEFCRFLHRQTFGNAGYHRRDGQREYGCLFDLAAWARELACDKSNVRRIRSDLVAARIITFQDDPACPGRGRITWNLALSDWLRYDHRGRPKASGYKQSDMVIIPVPDIITMPDCLNITTPASLEPDIITTPASLEPATDQGPVEPLRKGERKDTEEQSSSGDRSTLSARTREQARDDVGEYDHILDTLHEIDGWRRTPRTDKLERTFLQEVCPISVGSVGGYPPAFVASRATDFAFWWQTQVQPAADSRGESALPDIAKFRKFLSNEVSRTAFHAWRKAERSREAAIDHPLADIVTAEDTAAYNRRVIADYAQTVQHGPPPRSRRSVSHETPQLLLG